MAAVAAAAASAVLVPAAGAIPFGADLARPPDNPYPCAINPLLGIPWLAGTPQSCSWSYAGRLGDTSEGFNVPAGRGVLTAARVRTGPVTGPVQVAVVRSLRDPRSTALPVCCTVQFTSATFVPAPNAVTTVALPNVPVVNDRVVEPGLEALRYDTVALSMLAPNVPMPASISREADEGGFGLYPALVAGQERFEGVTALGGLVPLLNVEWIPAPEGSGIGAPGNDAGGAAGAGGAGGAGAVAPRATGITARALEDGARVGFRLDQAARVRAQLLRRLVVGARGRGAAAAARRVVLRKVGAPVVRDLAAGRRAITVRAPKDLVAGRYVVRLTLRSGAATRTVSTGFSVS